jgi:hypothetical protein
MQGKIARNDLKNMCTTLLLGRSNLMQSNGNGTFSITNINAHKSLMFHIVAYVFI